MKRDKTKDIINKSNKMIVKKKKKENQQKHLMASNFFIRKDVEFNVANEENSKMLKKISKIINSTRESNSCMIVKKKLTKLKTQSSSKCTEATSPLSKIKNKYDFMNSNCENGTKKGILKFNNKFLQIHDKECGKDYKSQNNILGKIDNNIIVFGNIGFDLSPKSDEYEMEYSHSAVEVFNKSFNTTAKLDTLNNHATPVNGEILDNEIFNEIELKDTIEMPESPKSSSEEESNNLLKDPIETLTETTSRRYRTHVFSKFCIFILPHSSTLWFCGKMKASLLHGEVEILGHKLTETPRELYSSSTSSLLCFETSICSKPLSNFVSALKNLNLNSSQTEKILKDFSAQDSALLMQPLNNKMTDFISKHLPHMHIFTSQKISSIENKLSKSLRCMFYDNLGSGGFVKNFTWNNVAKSIILNNERCVTLLGGGKNAGKSTMLKYLVNKLLNRSPVLVIDLDPGQPEFTVSGLLSATLVREPLLGANFTHLSKPLRSLSFGSINVNENIDRYVNCVSELYEFCNSECTSIPWIVNTMGYTGYTGLNLFTYIYYLFRPSVIIELKTNKNEVDYPASLNSDNLNSLLLENPYVNDDSSRHHICSEYYVVEPFSRAPNSQLMLHPINPRIERLLNVVSYISQILNEENSILAVTPYMLSLDKIKILFMNLYVEDKYVSSALNGRLVALCNLGNRDSDRSENVLKCDNRPVICHGYGLIRGVDLETRIAYVLTPVDRRVLFGVDSLLFAETLPSCCSILSVPNVDREGVIPYAAPAKEEYTKHRHLLQIPRRKFNPLRLLEIAKQSRQ